MSPLKRWGETKGERENRRGCFYSSDPSVYTGSQASATSQYLTRLSSKADVLREKTKHGMKIHEITSLMTLAKIHEEKRQVHSTHGLVHAQAPVSLVFFLPF